MGKKKTGPKPKEGILLKHPYASLATPKIFYIPQEVMTFAGGGVRTPIVVVSEVAYKYHHWIDRVQAIPKRGSKIALTVADFKILFRLIEIDDPDHKEMFRRYYESQEER